MEQKIGHYSFIIGVIIAVILGLAAPQLGAANTAILTSILVILGLIVGFLNVSGKETKEFLTIATILIIVAFAGGASQNLGAVMYIGQYLQGIFNAIMAFVVPATVIVALKDIWALGQYK
jgi:uncharacterized membrane protein